MPRVALAGRNTTAMSRVSFIVQLYPSWYAYPVAAMDFARS
jgi:hypothetical protein